MATISQLLELNALAKAEGVKYPKKRELYTAIANERGRHMTGIVGPRGVGKTVLLKQLAAETRPSIYVSLDTLEEDLFTTAKELVEKYKIELLLLDEVHFQKNYQQSLKKIFDFLQVRVVFTSSVSLSIFDSSYDLARRVKILTLYPFSFRQFLHFKKNILLPPLKIQEIHGGKVEEYLPHEFLFEEYLKGGLFPFALEEPDVLPLLKNTLLKILQKDIPTVANLRTDEIPLLEKTVTFIVKSPIDGINFSSVSQNIGITKYKAEEYLKLLERAFVLKMVWPKGTNVLKEPKVLMYLPYRLSYKDYSDVLGPLREDFFVQSMVMRGLPIHYLKSKRGAKTPDFLVQEDGTEWIVEVGGRGKGIRQFKGLAAKQKLILIQASPYKVGQKPLFLAGFF